MQRSGVCTKCGSRELVRLLARGHGGFAHISASSAVGLTRYACVACGYVEEWVEGVGQLEKLRRVMREQRAMPTGDEDLPMDTGEFGERA